MQRLRFLDTRSVACTLLCAAIVLVVQNGYACSWQADLVDYTTQETTHFSMGDTPVKIPIVQADKGVDVHCSLDPLRSPVHRHFETAEGGYRLSVS